MVRTVLEGEVLPGNESALIEAFGAARPPAGLLHSELLRDSRSPTRWRIETLWESRDALDRMRREGVPEGVRMFRAAGVEPMLSVFTVVATLAPDDR
ncbi:MAG TPA: antibiotic biosynthesis monooxygenase [Gemmatimonadaceae bacterium]|nr:antibiotic biosynthesis monooxygenase [Gemmatimonadaceae bacterium]